MIICVENLKESTKKLLEVINKVCKVAGYKIKLQKFNVFCILRTNRNRNSKELPLIEVPKDIKYIT